MRIHQFSSDDFSCLKDQWQDLLEKTDADKLFMSWYWMHSWWETYGCDSDELLLFGAYDDNNQLICIAPFYKNKKIINKYLTINVIQFIGTRFNGPCGFRIENLECLSNSNSIDQPIEFIFNYILSNIKFDEFWLHDLIEDSETHKQLDLLLNSYSLIKRRQSNDQSYGVDVSGVYDEYVSSLGKNTRLKFFNRRKVLETKGEVSLTHVNEDNYLEVLSTLSKFHFLRWETKISYKSHGEFIAKLISDNKINVRGIIVYLDDEIIGCTLELCVDNTAFNIQSGFKDGVDKKIAMGSLTLGYAIESYFESHGITYYDFLAGTGKNTNYKDRIATPKTQVVTEQLIYSLKLRFLYYIKDSINNYLN